MATWSYAEVDYWDNQQNCTQKGLSDHSLGWLCQSLTTGSYGMGWSVISGSSSAALTTTISSIFGTFVGSPPTTGSTTRAATGTNHSWILLKSPNNFRQWIGRDGTALSSSLYMLIDMNNTSTLTNTVLFSYEEPTTTGTIATAPSWANSSSYWGYDINQADELDPTHAGGATGDYVSTYMSLTTTTYTNISWHFGYTSDKRSLWFVAAGSTAIATQNGAEANTPQPRFGLIISNLEGASSDDVAPIVTFWGNMNTFSTITINQLINDTFVANGGSATMNNNAAGTTVQSFLRGMSQDGTTPVFNLMTTPFIYNAADLTTKSMILAANFTENTTNRASAGVSIHPIPIYTYTNGYKGIRGYLPNFYHAIRETISAADTIYLTTGVQVFGNRFGEATSTLVRNSVGVNNFAAGNLVFPTG